MRQTLLAGAALGVALSAGGCNLIEEANYTLEDEVADQLKLSGEKPESTPSPTVIILSPTSADTLGTSASAAATSITGTCEAEGGSILISVTDSLTGQVNSSPAPTCSGGLFSTTLDLSTLADGPLTLDAGQYDSNGTYLDSATPVLFAKDTTPPYVVSITRAPGYNAIVTNSIVKFRVQFSREITGISPASFSWSASAAFAPMVTGLNPVGGSSANTSDLWEVTYNVGNISGATVYNGILTSIVQDDDNIVDTAPSPHSLGDQFGGAIGTFGAGEYITIDPNPPVAVIASPSPTAAVLSASGSATAEVLFLDPEGVATIPFDQSYVDLTTSGSAHCQTQVTQSGAQYFVTVHQCSGTGSVQIGILPGAAIDLAGTPSAGSALSSAIAIDADPPSAPGITSPSCAAPPCLVAPGITVSGTCEAGASVTATVGVLSDSTTGGSVGSTTCTAAGVYSIPIALTPISGETRQLLVTQTDAAGNQSSAASVDVDATIVFRQVPESLSGFSALPSNLITSVYRDTTVSPQRLYVGTAQGLGIFNGSSWVTRTRPGDLNTNLITHVRKTSSRVIVGTNEGLAVSTDGGSTFSVPHYIDVDNSNDASQTISGRDVRDLFVDGQTAAVVTNDGVFISGDSGATFYKMPSNSLLINGDVWSVTGDGTNLYFASQNSGSNIFTYPYGVPSSPFESTNPNPNLTGSYLPDAGFSLAYSSGGSRLFAVWNNLLYYSDDQGATFTDVGYPISPDQLYTRVTASGSKVALSGGAFTGVGMGVYYSLNSGTDFYYSLITDLATTDAQFATAGTTTYLDVGTYKGLRSWSTASLPFTPAAVTPTVTANGLPFPTVNKIAHDGTRLYVATGDEGSQAGGLGISSDGGATFVSRLTNQVVRDVAFSGSTVYAATLHGLHTSNDSGATFTQDASLGNTVLSAVTVSDTGTVFVGTSSTLKSKAVGAGGFGNFMTGFAVTALQSAGSKVCVGTAGSGLYLSNNSGNGFTQVSFAGIAGTTQADLVNAVHCGSSKIYVGTQVGLIIGTLNAAGSWNWVFKAPAAGISAQVSGVFADPNGVLYVIAPTDGTNEGRLWVSRDEGSTFEYYGASEGLPLRYPGQFPLFVQDGAIYIGTSQGLSKTVSP